MKKQIIGIIYSGYGNIVPILNVLRIISVPYKIIESIADVTSCDKLIIPGVGAFDSFITRLKSKGLDQVIIDHASNKKPILGICIGAQILGKVSEEGELSGLGLFDMRVKKFDRVNNIRIPHMGWNQIKILKENYIFKDIDKDGRFYFVHSFHFSSNIDGNVLAVTNYGYEFPSIVEYNNIIAVQFHPEKSQKYGMQFIKNFSSHVC